MFYLQILALYNIDQLPQPKQKNSIRHYLEKYLKIEEFCSS